MEDRPEIRALHDDLDGLMRRGAIIAAQVPAADRPAIMHVLLALSNASCGLEEYLERPARTVGGRTGELVA